MAKFLEDRDVLWASSSELRDLPLSRRAALALQRQGYTTVQHLLDETEAGLLQVPNFGRRSLNEVKACLTEKDHFDPGLDEVIRDLSPEVERLRVEVAKLAAERDTLRWVVERLTQGGAEASAGQNAIARAAGRPIDEAAE
jgi:hypothetical protein